MAAEQTGSQLFDLDVRDLFEAGLESEELAKTRRHVVANIAGQWAANGLVLPNKLDVPGVLTYDSTDDLTSPCPIENAGFIARGYIDEEREAITGVLGQLGLQPDDDAFTETAAMGFYLEAGNRIQQLAQVMKALDKPVDGVIDLADETMHRHQYIVDFVTSSSGRPKLATETAPHTTLVRGMLLSQMQINIERDTTLCVVSGEPLPQDTQAPVDTEPSGRWRSWLPRFLAA